MFQSVEITPQYIKITFQQTPSVASLVNRNFLLYQGLGDDGNIGDLTEVTSAFKSIDPQYHYKSLSRMLYLFFEPGVLTNDQFYTLNVNIKSASGQNLQGYLRFGFGTPGAYDETRFQDVYVVAAIDEAAPTPDDPDNTAPPGAVEIHDYSLIKDAFSQLQESNEGQFAVLGTDPKNHEIFLEEDYENGRILVRFNGRPASHYVSPDYFRLQKKAFDAKSTSRWQTVSDTIVVMDSGANNVYVYLPSVEEDDTVPSVYNKADKVYFEDGYKYRLKVSGQVGTSYTG